MVEIHTFDSHEEMVAFVEERKAHAVAGLAREQQALTFGSYWVQFHDIPNRHIVFGRVPTCEEIALDMLRGPGGEVSPDADWGQVAQACEDAERNMNEGFLYGWAHDRFNPAGELGVTHKAHVWPIEKRLFDAATFVQFEIANLNETGRFLLDLAFRQMRAHVLGTESRHG